MEFVLIVVAIVAVAIFFGTKGSSSGGGGGGLLGGSFGSYESRVDSALRDYGVTVKSKFVVSRGRHEQIVYQFTGVDKAGVNVSGRVRFAGLGKPVVSFDGSTVGGHMARKIVGTQEEAQEAGADPETQIRREVARRMDVIQSNRDQFLANDVDGDGLVDADEWAAVRARIEKEVRAEFDGREPHEEAPTTPSDDGHW